jgi:hypothetical protein
MMTGLRNFWRWVVTHKVKASMFGLGFLVIVLYIAENVPARYAWPFLVFNILLVVFLFVLEKDIIKHSKI